MFLTCTLEFSVSFFSFPAVSAWAILNGRLVPGRRTKPWWSFIECLGELLVLKKSSQMENLIIAYIPFLKLVGSGKPVSYNINLIKRTLCYVVGIAPLVRFVCFCFCFFTPLFLLCFSYITSDPKQSGRSFQKPRSVRSKPRKPADAQATCRYLWTAYRLFTADHSEYENKTRSLSCYSKYPDVCEHNSYCIRPNFRFCPDLGIMQ